MAQISSRNLVSSKCSSSSATSSTSSISSSSWLLLVNQALDRDNQLLKNTNSKTKYSRFPSGIQEHYLGLRLSAGSGPITRKSEVTATPVSVPAPISVPAVASTTNTGHLLSLSSNNGGYGVPAPMTIIRSTRITRSEAGFGLCPFVDNNIWLVLRSPSTQDEHIALHCVPKYLATEPSMDRAVVLCDNGHGLLTTQNAFHVADNVVFVFDGTTQTSKSVRLVLYRNPAIIFTAMSGEDEGISFSTTEIASFLYFVGENVIVMKMLQIDGCFGVVDRYITAMAFIYLKRAKLSSEYFNDTLAVLSAFLLAHKMEEDECPGRAMTHLIYNSLPAGILDSEKQTFVNDVVAYQSQLFEKISYCGLVSREECEAVISVIPNHPIWKRWRLFFHGGAVRDKHFAWKLNFIQNSGAVFCSTSNENQQKCIMCKGNSTYCQSVQGRFSHQSSAHTQKLHLNNILASVKTTNALHNRLIGRAIPQSYQSLQEFASIALIDASLPWDYLQLLEIENQIENVLADEKYLENLHKCSEQLGHCTFF